jgi:benzoyl-CoA reductase/2-hydroxyglutaryl-CoA dehydratase subunit BcrC/BadD/HgdB
MEERIRMMFKLVQPAFLKHAPSNRKNFLSYSYVIHKFMQLLERDEYLEHFNLLKSREKLHEQDKVWAKICKELNWQFIPSI